MKSGFYYIFNNEHIQIEGENIQQARYNAIVDRFCKSRKEVFIRRHIPSADLSNMFNYCELPEYYRLAEKLEERTRYPLNRISPEDREIIDELRQIYYSVKYYKMPLIAEEENINYGIEAMDTSEGEEEILEIMRREEELNKRRQEIEKQKMEVIIEIESKSKKERKKNIKEAIEKYITGSNPRILPLSEYEWFMHSYCVLGKSERTEWRFIGGIPHYFSRERNEYIPKRYCLAVRNIIDEYERFFSIRKRIKL